jgi:hypothetical protein
MKQKTCYHLVHALAVAAIPLLWCAWSPSFAQAADHPSCAPWKAQWATAAAGGDLTVMDSIIGLIPALCPVLKVEAASGREAAAKRIEDEKRAREAEAARVRANRQAAIEKERAEREAAERAADPCVHARAEWPSVQSASESVVRSYRDRLPAACGVWRAQADEKLAAFAAVSAEQQRVETERQRTISAIAEARALGVEGSWGIVVPDVAITISCSAKNAGWIRIENGQYVYLSNPNRPEPMRFPIYRVDGQRISFFNEAYVDRAYVIVDGDRVKMRLNGSLYDLQRC